MKQITSFLCGFFLLTSLQAQSIKSSEVPSPVIHHFSFFYPDATRISWQVKEDKYQADFKNDKKSTRAVFMSDGSLFLTKTEIKICALPASALRFLEKDESDIKIDQASIIENDKGVITFEAVVDKTEFTFDHEGQHLISSSLAANAQD